MLCPIIIKKFEKKESRLSGNKKIEDGIMCLLGRFFEPFNLAKSAVCCKIADLLFSVF
jgi:hypothetical protein